MTADNYAPTTSLSSYYTSRDARSPARHWTTEKLIHDLAAIGLLSFFEGPGPNPMELTGASTSKLWLDVDAGVTAAAGTFKRYSGTGATTDEANWVAVTPAGYLLHLGDVTPSDAVEEYGTKAALEAAVVDGGVTHVRIGGYTSSGDGGGALYGRALAEPSHAGKIQSEDGAWWELAEVFPTPYHFGAQINGTTNDTTAFTNFLTYCATTGAVGRIPYGVLMTGPVSLTASVDVNIECFGTIKNKDGASATSALLTLTGTSSLSLTWRGGTLDGNGGAYTLFKWDTWGKADVHVDRVTGITCTTSSPATVSALWPSNVTRSRTGWGHAYDMDEGTSTQGSIPRVCSVSSSAESHAEIIAGGCADVHGTIVIGSMGGGKVKVLCQGLWRNVADNGIYNVGDAGLVQVFNPVIDTIDEPFLNSGTGIIDVYGGYVTGATNAVFCLQNCGGVRVKGMRAEANAQLAKFRSTNTASGFLHFEDCDFDHVIATNPPLDFSAGTGTKLIDKDNRWTIHHDSGEGSGNTIINADSDSFACIESDGSVWTLEDDTADVGSVTYFIETPTLTQESWWHSRLVNRTGNNNCILRLSAARQQLMSFSNVFSVSNIESENAINRASLSSAPPRVVWGTAVPSSGYWQAGSRVFNTAPSAGGSMGWVCVTAGSPGTWKTFGAIAA